MTKVFVLLIPRTIFLALKKNITEHEYKLERCKRNLSAITFHNKYKKNLGKYDPPPHDAPYAMIRVNDSNSNNVLIKIVGSILLTFGSQQQCTANTH